MAVDNVLRCHGSKNKRYVGDMRGNGNVGRGIGKLVPVNRHLIVAALLLNPHVAHRSTASLSVLALAAAGLGLALVPETLTQLRILGLMYKVLDEPKLSANLMLMSRAAETSGAVLVFVALAHSNATKASKHDNNTLKIC